MEFPKMVPIHVRIEFICSHKGACAHFAIFFILFCPNIPENKLFYFHRIFKKTEAGEGVRANPL